MNQLRTLLNSIKQTPFLNLILWTGFSMSLLTARVFWTGEITFVFLAWNLFLAWVPWFFSKAISPVQRGWKQLALLVGWILFFPNAPYILTDLFHLKLRLVMPLWFDLLLILSFAVSGLLLAAQSLHIMRKWLTHYIPKAWTEIATVGYLFLTAFGIYLGRFYRWNS